MGFWNWFKTKKKTEPPKAPSRPSAEQFQYRSRSEYRRRQFQEQSRPVIIEKERDDGLLNTLQTIALVEALEGSHGHSATDSHSSDDSSAPWSGDGGQFSGGGASGDWSDSTSSSSCDSSSSSYDSGSSFDSSSSCDSSSSGGFDSGS